MFTQTHLLLSAALFARPGKKSVTIAGLAGAVIPDSDVWLMFIVERSTGSTGCEVFHYRYWQDPWTTIQTILNSIPLYSAMLLVAGTLKLLNISRLRMASNLLAVFALSSLLHVCIDFLLHHDDARAQWMPFSDWVFRSPVSYWDAQYYGQIFAAFEIGLAILLIFIVGRRYARRAVWVILFALTLGFSGSVAASFMDMAGHDKGPGSCEPLPIVLE